MKFVLTIEAASFSELLGMLNGGTALNSSMVSGKAAATTQQFTPPATSPSGIVQTTIAPPDQPALDETGPVDASAPAVDSTGLPWDERIHAATKGRNADGTWRKRRGVHDTLVATVEAELKARAPQQPAAPPTMPQPTVPHMPITPPVTEILAQPVMPPMSAPQPVMPPMSAPQPATPVALDFQGFMNGLTAQMQRRDANGGMLITADYLAGVAAEISRAYNTPLNAITDLTNHPQMIGYAVQILQRDGRW